MTELVKPTGAQIDESRTTSLPSGPVGGLAGPVWIIYSDGDVTQQHTTVGNGTRDYTTISAAVAAGKRRIRLFESITEVADIVLGVNEHLDLNLMFPSTMLNMGQYRVISDSTNVVHVQGIGGRSDEASTGHTNPGVDTEARSAIKYAGGATATTLFGAATLMCRSVVLNLSQATSNSRVSGGLHQTYYVCDLEVSGGANVGIECAGNLSFREGAIIGHRPNSSAVGANCILWTGDDEYTCIISNSNFHGHFGHNLSVVVNLAGSASYGHNMMNCITSILPDPNNTKITLRSSSFRCYVGALSTSNSSSNKLILPEGGTTYQLQWVGSFELEGNAHLMETIVKQSVTVSDADRLHLDNVSCHSNLGDFDSNTATITFTDCPDMIVEDMNSDAYFISAHNSLLRRVRELRQLTTTNDALIVGAEVHTNITLTTNLRLVVYASYLNDIQNIDGTVDMYSRNTTFKNCTTDLLCEDGGSVIKGLVLDSGTAVMTRNGGLCTGGTLRGTRYWKSTPQPISSACDVGSLTGYTVPHLEGVHSVTHSNAEYNAGASSKILNVASTTTGTVVNSSHFKRFAVQWGAGLAPTFTLYSATEQRGRSIVVYLSPVAPGTGSRSFPGSNLALMVNAAFATGTGAYTFLPANAAGSMVRLVATSRGWVGYVRHVATV